MKIDFSKMSKEKAVNVKIIRFFPNEPKEGDYAFKYVQYTIPETADCPPIPMVEVYRAKFEVKEGSIDATMAVGGPALYLDLGEWKEISSGMGGPVDPKNEIQIANDMFDNPDPYIGY